MVDSFLHLVQRDLFQLGKSLMIYLDHAAATPVADNLAAVCGELLKKYSGNPEAAHRQGHDLRKELKNLEKQIFSAVWVLKTF